MSQIIKTKNIEKKLIEIRNQKVLSLPAGEAGDSDVAELYGVETK